MTLAGCARGSLLLFGMSLVSIAPARANEGRDGTLWLDLPDCSTPPYQREQLLHALDVETLPDATLSTTRRQATAMIAEHDLAVVKLTGKYAPPP